MIHDEQTTEIELPWLKKGDLEEIKKVVRVDFDKKKPEPISTIQSFEAEKNAALKQWISDLELNSPWVLRLLAVIAVLLLSMLVL